MIEKCERIRMPRLSEFKRIGGWKATEQALSYTNPGKVGSFGQVGRQSR